MHGQSSFSDQLWDQAGLRRFHCFYCNYGSTYKNNVVTHEHMHTGERPYQCFVCPKRFSDKSNMKSNMHYAMLEIVFGPTLVNNIPQCSTVFGWRHFSPVGGVLYDKTKESMQTLRQCCSELDLASADPTCVQKCLAYTTRSMRPFQI